MGIQFLFVITMLALATLAMPPTAAATDLLISEPKYGTSPVYVNSLTEFTLSGASEMWYRWDGYDYTLYTGPFHAEVVVGSGGAPGLPIPLEGLQTLYYNASGEAPPNSVQVFVDDYYPTTVAAIIGTNYTGDRTYITPNSGISLSATDSDSGVAGTYYKVDDGAYIQYLTPFKLTGNGAKTVYYYSTDNLGNKEPEKEFAVFVDGEPPAVEIVPGDPKILVSDTLFLSSTTRVSITARDSSGVFITQYRIGGGSWITYSSSFTLPSGGQHTITARATDNLAQQSGETALVVHVDNAPPEVFVVGHDSSSIQARSGDTIELECSDAGVGGCTIHYSTDGGQSWHTYTSPVMILEGMDLTYYATDALGNSAEHRTLQVTMDESKPWTYYLGIVMIAGAACLLVFTFVPFGRKAPEEPKGPPKREIKEKKEEFVETRPKRKRRNN